MNIDGLGKKVIEKFWNLNLIRYPFDIYTLNYSVIENLEGWGKLSVSNLKYSIDQSKKISLSKFIYSLGIRHIGQENAKLIADYIKNINNFNKLNQSYSFENFLNIDGIGETQIKSLKSFFSIKTNITIIKELSKYLKIQEKKDFKDGKLKDKSFLITGKLDGISRAEMKSIIEKNSGKNLSSVNSKLNYLIIGNKPTPKKIEKAQEMKIDIINQDQFNKLIS